MTFGLAGIMGWPVAQSRSPTIHNHWIAAHGLHGRYVPLPVPPERLAAALRGLPALGFRGCNVTMPHKVAVMPLLDSVDDAARRIGAVNTIVVAGDGTLHGSNTDGAGFMSSLLETQPAWRAASGPAVVVGAGGAARSVLAALSAAGAPELRVVNRTAEKAETLAAAFGAKAVMWAHRHAALADAVLLVNATDRGMGGKPALDLDLSALPAAAVVCDLVYVPLETPLLAAARARGNPVVGGLGMLLHQARPGFAAWFGTMPAVTPELVRAVQATF